MTIIAHGNIQIVGSGTATQQKMDICRSTSHLIWRRDAILLPWNGSGNNDRFDNIV